MGSMETRRAPSRLERKLWIHGSWAGSRRWEWRLAWVLEALHIPMVLALVSGYVWLPWVIPTTLIAAVMIGEAVDKGCPLTSLTAMLRHRVDPHLPSRTLWLSRIYEDRGRCFVLLVSFGLLGVASTIAAVVQHSV